MEGAAVRSVGNVNQVAGKLCRGKKEKE